MSDAVAFNPEMESGLPVYEAWRALTEPLYEMVVPDGAKRFSAAFLLNPFGDMAMIESALSAAIFRRDKAHLERSDRLIWVTQYLQGDERVRIGDETYALRPGAIYVRDMRRPSISRSSEIRQRNICLSVSALTDAGLDASSSLERRFDRETRSGRILLGAFEQAFHRRRAGLGEQCSAERDDFVGLLATLLSRSPGACDSVEARQARDFAMRRYLVERLDDPRIGVEDLCRVFACSRATVYRLFDHEGGVHRFLREQRLLRCCDELTRSQDQPSIGAIAARWGFDDAAYFSRMFKKTFGVAPMDARRASSKASVCTPVSASLSESIQRLHDSFHCS